MKDPAEQCAGSTVACPAAANTVPGSACRLLPSVVESAFRKECSASGSRTNPGFAYLTMTVAVFGALVAVMLSARQAASTSRPAMMAQTMILLAIASAFITYPIWTFTGLELSRQVVIVSAVPAVMVYVVLLSFWYLLNLHIRLSSSAKLDAALLGTAFFVGLFFWFAIRTDFPPSVWRLKQNSVSIAGVPPGLLGLEFLIGSEPYLKTGMYPLWSNPTVYQRCEGS